VRRARAAGAEREGAVPDELGLDDDHVVVPLGRCVPGYRFYLRMQHWGWPSKMEAPNVRVAAARAAQTVGYLERGKYSPTS